MDSNKTSTDNFDSFQLFIAIMKFKWLIILFVLLVTSISGYIAFKMPNKYTSMVNVVPPKSSGSAFESMMGNLSSALKDFGLSKLGGKGEGSYSFMVILNSRTVKDSLIYLYNLPKVYELPENQMTLVRKQFDENLNITSELEGNYTISITDNDPNRAASIANKYVAIANSLSQQIFQSESKVNREYLEDRLKGIEGALASITEALQKYSSDKLIFSPQDQAKSISSALADIQSEILKQEIVAQMLKNKFGESDPYTQQQNNIISELKKKYNTVTDEPGFAGNFSIKGSAKVGMDFMKLYAGFEAYSKVKAYLMPMLEEAKLNEKRFTQSLFIVDKALPPDKKSSPKRSLILLGAFVGSFSFSILIVVLLDSLRRLKRNYKKMTSRSDES